MKQKDFLLIGVVVFITALATFFGSSALFGNAFKHDINVEVVDAIDAEFPEPDSRYFNANSIDPTQLIQIGNNQNNQPFNSGQ